MNRIIIPIMGVALAAVISTNAQAGSVTGKWCFKWDVDFVDSDMGEDYVITVRPARYTYVTVQRSGYSTTGYFLDSSGCTANVTIYEDAKYYFKQFTRAKRGTRDVYVLADDEPWTSTTTFHYDTEYTTGSVLPNPYTKTFTEPWPVNKQMRIMPAVGNMLYFANTLAWDDGNDLKISLDPDAPTYCDNSYHHRESSTLSYICYEPADHKFGVAHEMGHMIAAINEGPERGDNVGSQGMFRDPVDGTGGCAWPADVDQHQCDSTCLGGDGHNLTSREFIGNATGEGWAQFIASATYNDPGDVTGTFVYGKKMMKWSNSHDGALTWPIVLYWGNPSYGKVYWEPPHVIALDSGSAATDFARWVEEECDPSGDDFEHYGTEWDWMSFFWNLWVDASNGFSVAEIAEVWDAVPTDDIAYFCCNDDISDCESSSNDDCIPEYPLNNLWKVGKLWSDDSEFLVDDSVRESALSIYGALSPKYWLFYNSGGWTRVNY